MAADAPRFFYNYSAACSEGFLSRSQWKKRGRRVLNEPATSFVVRRVGRSDGKPVVHPVIEKIEPGLYLFAEDCFGVFSVEQTVPSSSISSYSSIIISNSTPPTSIPITMLEDIVEEAKKPHNSRENEGNCNLNNFSKTEKLLRRKLVYNPTNLDASKLLKVCQEHEEEIRLILHVIHYRHCMEALPKEAFVPLKAEYLRREIPGWQRVKPLLLKARIIETDHYYIEGQKCYGYRAGKAFRDSPYRLITIQTTVQPGHDDENQHPLPVHNWLKRQAQRIEVVPGEQSDQLALIADGVWKFNTRDGFGWRFHSNLTHLKTEARRSLRVRGKPLAEIDIKNSQPLFLAKLLLERGIEGCERYIEICQQDLYAHLAAKAGVGRALLFPALGFSTAMSNESRVCRIASAICFDFRRASFVHHYYGMKTPILPPLGYACKQCNNNKFHPTIELVAFRQFWQRLRVKNAKFAIRASLPESRDDT